MIDNSKLTDTSKAYSVTHWGSHPDKDNDDCWTGDDFDTLEEAKASEMYKGGDFSTEYIMLDGPDINEVRKNPNYSAKEKRFNDNLDRSEHAMQQGMGLGIHAYNEAMGADVEEYPGDDFEGRAYQEWRRDQRREAEG